MAITTLAGVLSGLINPQAFSKASPGNVSNVTSLITFWGISGFPKSGSWNTTLNGVTLSGSSSNVTGQIPYVDPVSGNGYIAKFEATLGDPLGSGNGIGELILADRLWHNGGINTNTTSAQTITSPTWPARDAAGSTNGDGVLLAIEQSNPTGSNTTTTATISYTNSAGTSGQSTSVSMPLGDGINDMFELPLAAGDTGVQSVQSITLGTAALANGTLNIVAYRPIAVLTMQRSNKLYSADAVQLGFPRIYNGSVLYLIQRRQAGSGNGAGQPVGQILFAQG